MNNENIELKITNLRKYYGTQKILDNVNITVEKGKITGLLGRNGAGKSTLMKCILGLITQYDGIIELNGRNINEYNGGIVNYISSLVDVRFYEDMTAYENLNFLLLSQKLIRKERNRLIFEALSKVGLVNNANKKVSSFSFGMKQRLALAQVFLSDSDLLILDEPFVGLDPIGIEEMKKILNELVKKGKTILFSSHQLNEVEDLAECIVVIEHGCIKYEGTMNKLLNQDMKYRIYYKGQTLPIEIAYNTTDLQTILKNTCLSSAIEKIEVTENALLKILEENG